MRMTRSTPWLLCSSLALLTIPVLAQYKVVGPDGKVTYTDQPPQASAGAQTQALSLPGSGAPATANLPAGLRAVVARYPVTLYAAKGCGPCDSGRQLLVQRGIPFSEKSVDGDADGAALVKLAGDRTLPVLTIGSQQLKGYHSTDWASYLDAAGYPKTSELPPSYRQPAAVPLAPQAPTQALVRGQTERGAQPRPATAPPADPKAPGIRF